MDRVNIVSFTFELEPEANRILTDAGLQTRTIAAADRTSWTTADLLAAWNKAGGAEGMISGADLPLDRAFLLGAKGLKAISLNCAGYDHVDLRAAAEAGIKVCNVPRQNFDAVADFTWGMILSLMRRIVEGDRMIRAGHWCSGVEKGMAVCGKTLGIIGFGAIGQAVAKRAGGFDMTILSDSRKKDPELARRYGVTYVSTEELLAQSDIIVLSCPLIDATWHLINQKTLALVKPSAVLINPSRGPIIDTEALVDALQSGRLAGAALDVFETEPLYASPLFEMPQLVLTPHMGGLADREINRVACQSARNLADLLQGNPVNSQL